MFLSRKTLLVLFMLCAMTASAHDRFPPVWRGQEGTTYQHWRFDTDDNPAVPEIINNPYGQAAAVVTVGNLGEGWIYDLGLGTQTGMWDMGGLGGRMVIDVDNRSLAQTWLELWVQIVYYEAISVAPAMDIPGAQRISSQTILIENDGALGGWYLDQSVWRMGSNPTHAQIVLVSNPSWGSLVDQVVVDTVSVPAGCIVDMDDLARFCGQWLQTGPGIEFDLNDDSRVDFKDFNIFAQNWLGVCPW